MSKDSPVRVTVEGAIAVVMVDNPPVNALSHAVRGGLWTALRETEANPAVHAVVLACAGRTFIAGADIREIGKSPAPPDLPSLLEGIEAASKPWIAAIHGTALGGGLETALVCSHRVASQDAMLGLPEVTLGIIPGAGGTVRLPRIVPAELALRMVATGKPIPSGEALEAGLVDAVAGESLMATARSVARSALRETRRLPVSQRPALGPGDPSSFDEIESGILKKAGQLVAPGAAARAVRSALAGDAGSAFRAEREAFLELRDSEQAKALRYVFFAERAAGQIDEIKGVEAATPGIVGVIGGGTMGAGIAAACLLRGLPVILVEQDADAAHAGRNRVEDILDGSRARGLLDDAALQDRKSALSVTSDNSALKNADLLIEAVFEDMKTKKAVFQALDRHTRAGAVLASNTSYLDLNELAEVLDDPSRLIGLHFFAPAHIMKLLELVIPDKANPHAIATGAAFGRRLGKITVPAGVCDGFIGNRIMSRYRGEADQIMLEGAWPWEIDQAMRAFGFPMGIYEMQDLAGLDIAWAMRKRRAEFRDPDARYVAVADRLCEAGRFGRKTGRGWYLYPANGSPEPDPEVEALVAEEATRHGVSRRSFAPEEIMSRILTTMQDEAKAVLSEGIARRSGDIDVVLISGYGFPRWRGGPMFMAKD